LQLVLAVSISRRCNQFVDAGRAAMEDAMPAGKGSDRGNVVDRRQGAEIPDADCRRGARVIGVWRSCKRRESAG
jgi:hypothetical protein